MMNYRTVLRDFSPIEWGDFLMRFAINQRSYVLSFVEGQAQEQTLRNAVEALLKSGA